MDIAEFLKPPFKGTVKCVQIKHGESASPPPGKMWMILSGVVNHAQNLASQINGFWGSKDDNNTRVFLSYIASTEETGIYPLFNPKALLNQSLWVPAFIDPDGALTVTCDAGGFINVQVLEFYWLKTG